MSGLNDLRQINRNRARAKSDGHAENEATGNEVRWRTGQTHGKWADREDYAGDQDHFFAAYLVGEKFKNPFDKFLEQLRWVASHPVYPLSS